jgi:hypothetical protein
MSRGNTGEATRRIRGQIGRRYIDSSLLNVNVVGNVVHLTGVIRPLRTYPNVDLREEMEHISKILKQSCGMREVVWEVTLRV